MRKNDCEWGLEGDQRATERWSELAARPVLVLDIEARSDDVARRLARRTRGPTPMLLREIVSVSCLRLTGGSEGTWQLETFHRDDDLAEVQILGAVDELVRAAAAENAVLVTYNGAEHDLPLLRSRELRWWKCHHSGLLPYLDGKMPHVDVMRALLRGGKRYARLTDACASVGVSLFGPIRLEVDRELPAEQEKGELDVIGTALLYHFLLADRLASSELLSQLLADLSTFLDRQAVFRPHLRAIARAPVFQIARRLMPSGQYQPSRPRPARLRRRLN